MSTKVVPMTQSMRDDLLASVTAFSHIMGVEYEMARRKFGPFDNAHEGYAVILEEVEELWTYIKMKGSTNDDMMAECVQIATMAFAFVYELLQGDENDG